MSLNQELENSPMAQWNQAEGKPAMPIRFTPTGEISHAKTRVYTQRYRKEWESLPDFQGWLTSIPYHPTRAYCLYCKKDLHAHRLSLLKHMCTMKHQRSALAKQCNGNLKPNIQYIDTNSDQDKEHYMQEEYLEDTDIQYFVEKLDMGEEGGVEYEARYEESFEEVEDDPSNVEYITTVNQKGSNRDALEVAMAHVHSEDMGQEEQVEMMESNDSQDIIICEATEEGDKRESNDNKGSFDENTVIIRQKQSQTARKSMKRILVNPSSAITVTPTGKTVTLQNSKSEPRTKYVVKNIKGNLQTLVVTPKKDDEQTETIHLVEENENEVEENITASTETTKAVKKDNSATKSGASDKKSRISTHVIDTNKGSPISGLPVSIYKLVDGRWTFLNESSTMANGYCNDLIDPEKTTLTCGRYKLHFDVDKYFTNRDIETIYPFIEIAFDVKNPSAQYHMPILLSPFGYTTYRGCES